MEGVLNFFCGWIKDGVLRCIATFSSLDGTVAALRKEMRELRGARDDVQREVDKEEIDNQLECTGEVREWLEGVEELDRQMASLELSYDRQSGCTGLCSVGDWWSAYQLAVTAAVRLEEARGLKRWRGELGAVARRHLPPPVEELPLPRTVRKDLIFQEVMEHLRNKEVGIIGIYGDEGVGKTYLLKQINNQFAREICGFSVVILVEVSQNPDLERIQREIGDRIGLTLPGDQRAKILRQALSRRSFLLLLDNVPRDLSFLDIGVPLPTPKNGCKIVLSAREEQVCVNMDALQRVKVTAMEFDEAWSLFCLIVGSNEALDSTEIVPHAQAVVKICRGLPLAVVIMGKAMATKRSLSEWETAAAGQGMPEKVRELLGLPGLTGRTTVDTTSTVVPPEKDGIFSESASTSDEIPSELRSKGEQSMASVVKKHAEERTHFLETDKQHRSPDDHKKQRENEDFLVKYISQPLGFTVGKPTAACLIYICLRGWKKLEADNANIFDQIIQTIGTAIEEQEGTGTLLYWLSNIFTLLLLIEQGQVGHGVAKVKGNIMESTGFLWRMRRGIKSSLLTVTPVQDPSNEVKAKFRSLLFKQQLVPYAEKIYKMVRDDMKRDLSPQLLQAPRKSRLVRRNTETDTHWDEIVNRLKQLLKMTKNNYVAPVIVQKMFLQIFWFINVQVFNSVLLRRECCTFTHGEYLKVGLDKLESWCTEATEQFTGSALDELKHLRQATSFLVTHVKGRLTIEYITKELCPMLSIKQIYRISTLYNDDKYGTRGPSSEAIHAMRYILTNQPESDIDSSSFLLEDDLSLPFSFNELLESAELIEIPYVELPQPLEESLSDVQ